LKILILGSFNTGALEHHFFNGFIANDVEVLKYDVTQNYLNSLKNNLSSKLINRLNPNLLLSDINKKIINFCKQSPVDVIFVNKGSTIFPSTLQEIRLFCKLIVNYNPDHPFIFHSRGSGNKNVSNSIMNYDILFSYSKNICKKVKEIYKVNTYWIPFGYDPKLDNINLRNSINSDRFLFVGAFDNNRANLMESLKRNDFDIYGDGEWFTKTAGKNYVRNSFKNAKLYGNDLIQKSKEALASLNILREQNINENAHNMRTFEVPGMGGTLISNFTEEQAYFFEPDKEMIYFSSTDELNDRLNHLKSHHDQALKIRINALERSRKSNYNYNHRCREMLQIIKTHLK